MPGSAVLNCAAMEFSCAFPPMPDTPDHVGDIPAEFERFARAAGLATKHL